VKHEEMKVISYERACLLFIFNFHPTVSHSNLRLPVRKPGINNNNNNLLFSYLLFKDTLIDIHNINNNKGYS
jgi:hypothetical protein